MSYKIPEEVNSPKNRWRLLHVLYDGGELDWSAAHGQWDNDGQWDHVIAIRWNGSDAAEIGNPQSRGLATWFVVPDELQETVLKAIAELPGARKGEFRDLCKHYGFKLEPHSR